MGFYGNFGLGKDAWSDSISKALTLVDDETKRRSQSLRKILLASVLAMAAETTFPVDVTKTSILLQ